MKYSAFIAIASAATPALTHPQFISTREFVPQKWIAPTPDASRGPCPGLNTLANHGYIPRDGKNITLDILKDGMLTGYNIENLDAVILFTQAIKTSPNADLRSRSDAFFADPNPFNETVWAESLTYFPDDLMTVEQVAKARMGRLATSKKTNPERSLSKLADGFSWGEMASFFEIMADGTTGTVEKKFIEYWLKNERMSTEIGWQRRPTIMRGTERIEFTRKLMQAAGVARRDIKTDAYGRKLVL
ncbi:hypothetical protein FNYG_10127 [Fusarium nygamai]|uniref:Heme haloperoxidase family profile domain-containing protein n=1 Tax=Gibberella nygamai TaxID=42673 RepID=A0A2K0W349_GIBNY|nr:hypothetical protein FNYG_10127 [Fusarium nygamai]